MKKIIPHFSTKTLLKILIFVSLSLQNTTSLNQHFTASANSDVESTIELPTEEAPLPDVPDAPTDIPALASPLIIQAFNPGYTVNGVRDVGEFIELQNTTDASISLAGYSLRYTNSSGKQTTLVSFSEGSSMVGEFLLLRLARTANSAEAEMVYTTTLAMSNAQLELLYRDEVVDRVCWSKAETCVTSFDSKKPSTLARDAATGEFAHWFTDYDLHYDPERPSLQLPPEPEETPPNDQPSADHGDNSPSTPPASEPEDDVKPEVRPAPHCRGLEFTEVLSYYADNQSEQFLELYNATDGTINLSGCKLNYKKKFYSLTGTIAADSYLVIYPAQFTPSLSLTKNPNSSNTVELLDADDEVVDILVYPHGQKKSVAYAKFIATDGSESWNATYASTPGATNVYQEFRTCPTGKVINPATGNCIKVTAPASTTSECPAGKYRNPLTGRCKNIESPTSEPKPCADGYERNPETNRCRKIKAENDGAGYALVPTTYSSKSTFVAFGVVALLILLGMIYIILQFRHEITRMARKVCQRFYHIRKNLVARGISFHRHKKP